MMGKMGKLWRRIEPGLYQLRGTDITVSNKLSSDKRCWFILRDGLVRDPNVHPPHGSLINAQVEATEIRDGEYEWVPEKPPWYRPPDVRDIV